MHVFDRRRSRLPQPWRTIIDWTVTLAVAFAFVLIFEAKVAKPYRIPSESMEPTLLCAKPALGCLGSFSDRVIALRLAYDLESPSRRQIVVFKAPVSASKCGSEDGGTTFIKRLIGLPGETVFERDGYISIGKNRLNEPYVDPALRDHQSGSWRVGPNHYFFLGDNRANSCDSRTWGNVPRNSLIGPVVLRYWPINRLGAP